MRFFVRGEPKAQPRVKPRNCGAHASVYDPGTANGWKACVVREARPFRPPHPLEAPLSVSLVVYLPRPKALMRRKDPEGLIWCAKKPDRDNLDKAVLDCLKDDGWFRDDSQVVTGGVSKVYHAKGGVPGCLVTIETDPALGTIPWHPEETNTPESKAVG